MAKAKKDGKFFNCYLNRTLWERLTRYSDVTGVPKTVVIEKSLSKYLDSIANSVIFDPSAIDASKMETIS